MLDAEPRAAVIDGKAVAAKLCADIAIDAGALADDGWQPHLVSISVGDTAVAELYVRNQQRSAESAGVTFEARNYPTDISMEQLVGVLQGLNAVEILKTLPLEGLNVTVIGHSEIVGKPIAFLLMGLGATVTVCHHMTRSVAMHSRAADVVIVAVGKAGLVTGDMLKPGAALIDIGINRGDGKTVGDADLASCADVAGWITPVPGGVGPVPVAILMKNAVLATAMQKAHYQNSSN